MSMTWRSGNKCVAKGQGLKPGDIIQITISRREHSSRKLTATTGCGGHRYVPKNTERVQFFRQYRRGANLGTLQSSKGSSAAGSRT